MRKSPLFLVALLFSLSSVHCQETDLPARLFSPESYSISIREDYSVRENGRYSGYLSRELYGNFHAAGSGYPLRYEGHYYGTGAIRRDAAYLATPLEVNISTAYLLDAKGFMHAEPGGDAPLRMNIPVFVTGGDTEGGEEQPSGWTAPGRDVLLYGGEIVPVDTTVAYVLEGESLYEERPVLSVSYRYPLRLRSYQVRSLGADSLFRELFGTVEGTLMVFLDDEGGMFMKERILRRIVTAGGENRDEEGFRLIWYNGIRRENLIALADRITGTHGGGDAGGSADGGNGADGGEAPADRREIGGVVVETRPEGLVLTLPDIHFEPDTAVILPDERPRLDELARALSAIRGKSFLVIGHTADVGSRESQETLSVQRAKRIVEEMAARGLDEGRFLYDGVGGSSPVAGNDTEEGRAQNRRVEVLVLD